MIMNHTEVVLSLCQRQFALIREEGSTYDFTGTNNKNRPSIEDSVLFCGFSYGTVNR
jgi:hypothetical protein